MYRLLRKNIVLSERRSPIWSQNRAAKIGIYIMGAFASLYLILISISLAYAANNDKSFTGGELLFGIMPFILSVDFLFRFVAQQTPAQLVKPYVLLPVPRYSCINCFVISSLLSWGNIVWFALLIPYLIMAVTFSEGIFVAIAYLLVYYIMILANSQWYLISRTLINDYIWWWWMPAILYAIIYMPLYITGKLNIDKFCLFYSHLSNYITSFPIIVFLCAILILAILVLINRRLQYVYTWKELGKEKAKALKNVSNFNFFDRYGQTGEFIKLEVKSIMRNKKLRKSFISAIAVILMFSMIISFTSTYGSSMTFFWMFYNFSIIGAMLIVKIMGIEGNYIDGLLVHKENILALLTAKYYFYSALLVLPFVLLLPTVFTGKSTLFELISIMLFTAGLCYFLFFQMAVYNKNTIPLNNNLISKGGIESNYIPMVVNILVFLVPTISYSIVHALFGDIPANFMMLIIGIIFIAIHKICLKNIYVRMMKRKYDNLDGFRSSRR